MNRKILCVSITLLLFSFKSISQKTEITIGVNANLSFFRGNNTTENESFTVSDTTRTYPYRNNEEYSKMLRLGGNVEAVIQRIFKDNFIIGFAGSGEVISGRIKIYDFSTGFTNTQLIGKTTTTQTFINLYPFMGWRFKIKPYAFDINIGWEVGLPVTAHEKTIVSSTSGNKTITQERDRRKVTDLRPRMQFRLQRGRYGIQTGFALGVTNYTTGFSKQAYSGMMRLGVFYRLM